MNHISKFTVFALLISSLLLTPLSENTGIEAHSESYQTPNQFAPCSIIPKTGTDDQNGSGSYIFTP